MSHIFPPWSVEQMAKRVLQDIPDGAVVNLGIGQPMEIANQLPPDKEIVIHCENGILGAGRLAVGDEVDDQLVNAGKQAITLVRGASLFHHGDSFTMIRGGHIDICVLGAFQVSVTGDLANWRTLDRQAVPAVGGAMDLASGAKQVFVMMELRTRSGACKLVPRCTYPLTAASVVKRIYTDLGVFDIGGDTGGVRLVDAPPGIERADLEALIGLSLT